MKKWGIVISLFVVFALSVVSGFLVRSFINFSKKDDKGNPAVLAEDKTMQENETVDTSSSAVTVSPNAEVIMTQTYKKCGHTVTTKEIAPREIVNLNKEKVLQTFLTTLYVKKWRMIYRGTI